MTNRTPEEISKYIKDTELKLKKLDELSIVAQTRLQNARQRLQEENDKLKEMGIANPNVLDEEIKKNALEIENTIKKLNELLPADIMKKYERISKEDLADMKDLDGLNINQAF